MGAYVFCDSGAYPALWAASVGRCVPNIPCYPVLVVVLPGPTSVNAKGAEKTYKKQRRDGTSKFWTLIRKQLDIL